MSKKHKGGPGPVPPDNRPHTGPAHPEGENEKPTAQSDADSGAAFQEQDPKRRLGGYATAGEHPIQQPRPLNDGE